MTDEQLSKEFKRWLNADRPKVWVRHKEEKEWEKMKLPCWNSRELYYIVDDEQAKLRMLQIDKPDTKFQIKVQGSWRNAEPEELWFTDYEYRVEPKPKEWYKDPEMVGKPIWVRDNDKDEWNIGIFVNYANEEEQPFQCKYSNWLYAKPVKSEDLYQGVTND